MDSKKRTQNPKKEFLLNVDPSSENELSPYANYSIKSIDSSQLNTHYTRKQIHTAMIQATLSSLFYAFNTIVIKETKNLSPNLFTPFNFSWWRGVTSSIFLFYYIKMKEPNNNILNFYAIRHKTWCVVRTFGFYLGFVFFVWSLLLLRVSTVQVLCSISPVVSLVVSCTMLKEKFYFRYVIGIALCFIGSAIILGTEKGNTTQKTETFNSFKFFLGICTCCINFMLNGFVNVGQKVLAVDKMSNNQQVFYVSLSLVVCSFVACLFTFNFGFNIWIFSLGTLNGFFFYMANHYYQEAIAVLNVGGCVPFNYLCTIFVFILCAIVLHEPLFWTDLVGSLVIMSFHGYNAWKPITN